MINQIDQTPNVEVLNFTEIVEAKGDGNLQELSLLNVNTKEIVTKLADALYIFIGAKPYTDWIQLDIIKNDKGFLQTGRDLESCADYSKIWKLARDPYLLETSSDGIFAAGDVRAGAMNRVASAVGEESMAISFVHKYLAEV